MQQIVTINRKAFISNLEIEDRFQYILFSDDPNVKEARLYTDDNIIYNQTNYKARLWTIKYQNYEKTIYNKASQNVWVSLDHGEIEATCWYTPDGECVDCPSRIFVMGYSASRNETFGVEAIEDINPDTARLNPGNVADVENQNVDITVKSNLSGENFIKWVMYNNSWSENGRSFHAVRGQGGLAIPMYGNIGAGLRHGLTLGINQMDILIRELKNAAKLEMYLQKIKEGLIEWPEPFPPEIIKRYGHVIKNFERMVKTQQDFLHRFRK